jgi:uncharacterized protein (TIGR02246 family)
MIAKIKLTGNFTSTPTKQENHPMSQRSKLLAVFVAALASFGVLTSSVQASQNQSADEAAIRKVVKQLEDGWNAHDGKAFAAPFANDADYVVVNGMKFKGKEAIETGHTQIFTTIYKDSHNVGTIKSIRFLRPDVAIVHVEWNLEFSMGGETRKASAMNTMVMAKEGGKWNIAAFQNTPIQPQGR